MRISVVAPDSRSYPVLAAADAAGVPYRLALAYVEACKDGYDGLPQTRAFEAMGNAGGPGAAMDCAHRLIEAVDGGLIYRGAR